MFSRIGALFIALALCGTAVNAVASDTYDKEATEVSLKRAARQVKQNCGLAKDANGKAAGPWGTTKVSVVLGHNGHSKISTVPSPFEGTPTGRCTVQAFSNLTFPPWAGADITVEWDVELVEPKN
jgi:hypothetical protein